MSAAKVKANAPHRLIVEGRDDQWTIIELTAKHGWNWENPDSHYPYTPRRDALCQFADNRIRHTLIH